MRSLALIASLALLALPACSFLSDPEAPVNKEHLTQHWVHSHEEEREMSDAEIYRPDDDRDFPFSWFRMQYIFSEDGDCEWLYLAPNDRHYFRPGTWLFDSEEENVIRIQQGEKTVSYRILELAETLLRMTRAENS